MVCSPMSYYFQKWDHEKIYILQSLKFYNLGKGELLKKKITKFKIMHVSLCLFRKWNS